MIFHFIFFILLIFLVGFFTIQEGFAQSITVKPFESNVYQIGHPVTIYLYDPDLNLNSEQAESHSLDLITFRFENVEVTMGPKGSNQEKFNPKPSVLRETGDSSGLFYSVIEIPRTLKGQTIKFGSKILFEYEDAGSAASVFVGDTTQKTTLEGYISNLGAKIEFAKKNTEKNESYLPPWIKSSAKWWAKGILPDSSFKTGLQQMIQQNYIQLNDNFSKQVTIQSVPEWFKVTALLWSEGIVSDSEFVNSIEFLINNKIIGI